MHRPGFYKLVAPCCAYRAHSVSVRSRERRSTVRLPIKEYKGFTLVEVLVVIAIVGILLAVLLPAVQAARESARRAGCENNLRQIGLAFQNHASRMGAFPSGGWDFSTPPTYLSGKPATGIQQDAGWAFQILPFLEGGNTWSGSTGGTDQQLSIAAVGAMHDVYFCPSRRSPQSITYSDPYYLGGQSITHALCDYAASNLEGTGAVRQYRPVTLREITDGTSNTLVVGDKRMNVAELGKWQEDDNEGYTCGWDEDTIRTTSRPPEADYRGPGDGDELFGSSHASLCNFVFADGSVHNVSYEIDAAVFQNLGNKSDGKTITPGGF